MKLNFWKALLFFAAVTMTISSVFPSPAVADTEPEYAGAYSQDLVWENTVTMSADVLILKGASLTVRAGTQVNVVPAEGTKIAPEYFSSLTELLVRGTLDIQGTPDDPVRFVIVDKKETAEISWSGITLDNASESRVQNAELERADIAIRCVGSSPHLKGNRIKNCRYGIVAQQKSHPRILENILVNGEGGIFCWRDSNPYLLGNRINGHDEEAIFVDASSRPRFERNVISGNAIGLALYPRDLQVDLVSVTENTENVRWLGQQGQGGAK